MLDKNTGIALQNMEQLDLLIRGALTEMRALLLELHPSEFREKNLAQLLYLLAESTRARSRVDVTFNANEHDSLPEDVALALYRIAQESLNNVAKHALASEVVVDLTCSPHGARLMIKDDGRGFDPQAIPAGHLGVGIMRERAQAVGASIKIESENGRGTQVTVSWLAPGDNSDNE
jgi:two-component system nitrate/nitrite sensor histidine kinase NarX